MATYIGQVPTEQPFRSLRDALRASVVVGVSIYYYRTSGGTRASTADLASIPAGAVIERIVTQ